MMKLKPNENNWNSKWSLLFFCIGFFGSFVLLGLMGLATQVRHAPWFFFAAWMLVCFKFCAWSLPAAKRAFAGSIVSSGLMMAIMFWWLHANGLSD